MGDYRVSEVARLLGVSQATVRKMVEAGAIKSYRVPNSQRGLRIPEAEVKRIRGE